MFLLFRPSLFHAGLMCENKYLSFCLYAILLNRKLFSVPELEEEDVIAGGFFLTSVIIYLHLILLSHLCLMARMLCGNGEINERKEEHIFFFLQTGTLW